MQEESRPAWLMLAVGDNRQHGGNDGYDDRVETHYSWDSTVPHAGRVGVGEAIVLWDKQKLLGASVIERIERGEKEKWRHRCPNCERAAIKARRRVSPRFKCYKCKHEFDDPKSRHDTVKTYRSHHEAGWMDLKGYLTGGQLRALCVSPKSQLSLRPLLWSAFRQEVGPLVGGHMRPLEHSAERIAGGHKELTVRVRVGQAEFRRRLLQEMTALCAFTGSAPASILEASHLYSYAREGKHHNDGGLLLRRDVHRLFDLGELAVDPATWRIDVSPELRMFPTYSVLHGHPMSVSLSPRQQTWLRRHWRQNRPDRAAPPEV